MRVMTILGSPRRQGNTAKVLGWIEGRLRADGHDLDAANMLDYNVGGCSECLACKKGAVELCSIDDDANGLYRRMVAADLVLIAAPIFCWGFPAQIKGLIDRMYCMMDFAVRRPGAAPAPQQADGAAIDRRRGGSRQCGDGDPWISASGGAPRRPDGREHLFVGGCTTPEKMANDVKTRAIDFATMLGDQLRRDGSPT